MDFYPQMIKNLPQIDLDLPGIKGWLFESNDRQVVFFEIEPIGKMPDHSHCTQWGFVLDGNMKLTIDGKTSLLKKGDKYYIPEGTIHSAEFLTKVFVMDMFDSPDRYRAKK